MMTTSVPIFWNIKFPKKKKKCLILCCCPCFSRLCLAPVLSLPLGQPMLGRHAVFYGSTAKELLLNSLKVLSHLSGLPSGDIQLCLMHWGQRTLCSETVLVRECVNPMYRLSILRIRRWNKAHQSLQDVESIYCSRFSDGQLSSSIGRKQAYLTSLGAGGLLI